MSRRIFDTALVLVLLAIGASLAPSTACAQTAPAQVTPAQVTPARVTPAQVTPAREPAQEPASSRLEVRPVVLSRVEQALRSIDSAVPARFWEQLGIEGLGALALVVDDGSRPLGMRRRAVVAMRHYRSADARSLLISIAEAQAMDELLSRYALGSLAAAFGLDALEPLLAGLRDARPMVREGAVLAIAGLPRRAASDARIRSALETAGALETERFVREAIDTTVARR